MKVLVDAYYDLLDGISVSVFKEQAPQDQVADYVLLRSEGGSNERNKTKFVDDCVVIVDIVTHFNELVDTSVVEGIDAEITALLRPTVNAVGLGAISGYQAAEVERESFTYVPEEGVDGNKVYRKVSRYNNRLVKV